jgi:hypothetical protein
MYYMLVFCCLCAIILLKIWSFVRLKKGNKARPAKEATN